MQFYLKRSELASFAFAAAFHVYVILWTPGIKTALPLIPNSAQRNALQIEIVEYQEQTEIADAQAEDREHESDQIEQARQPSLKIESKAKSKPESQQNKKQQVSRLVQRQVQHSELDNAKQDIERQNSAVNATPNYFINPKPVYPIQSRRLRQEGTVELLVEVDLDGNVIKVDLNTSSGYKLLDKAAISAVQNWKFKPAELLGRPIQSKVVVPIKFELKDAK